MPPGDEDYERPACFIIEAPTAHDALRWGDHLSASFSLRNTYELFLRCQVEDASFAEGDLSSLPVVPVGYEATDAEIGW
jgi:hypothetical protein